MNKFSQSPIFFITAYVPFLVMTYVLPYFGSNSLVAAAITESVKSLPKGPGLNIVIHEPAIWPYTLLHIVCLAALVGLSFYRGQAIQKTWLWLVPLIAAAFDLTPVLSSIPFVPTFFHLITLATGVMTAQKLNASHI
jgi:hypothetical protein